MNQVTETSLHELDRRGLLRGGLLWGTAAAVAATAGGAEASARSKGSGQRARRKLTLDVACLGDTFVCPPFGGDAFK